jgi:hypothetical protein
VKARLSEVVPPPQFLLLKAEAARDRTEIAAYFAGVQCIGLRPVQGRARNTRDHERHENVYLVGAAATVRSFILIYLHYDSTPRGHRGSGRRAQISA